MQSSAPLYSGLLCGSSIVTLYSSKNSFYIKADWSTKLTTLFPLVSTLGGQNVFHVINQWFYTNMFSKPPSVSDKFLMWMFQIRPRA
jgi:hypothetical protein